MVSQQLERRNIFSGNEARTMSDASSRSERDQSSNDPVLEPLADVRKRLRRGKLLGPAVVSWRQHVLDDSFHGDAFACEAVTRLYGEEPLIDQHQQLAQLLMSALLDGADDLDVLVARAVRNHPHADAHGSRRRPNIVEPPVGAC